MDRCVEEISFNLDRRKTEMARLRRVVLAYSGNVLEDAVVLMSIPMVYAHWEGYVKEVCQLYLEYIERSVESCSKLKPELIGYLWRPTLRKLVNGYNWAQGCEVAKCAISSLPNRIAFGKQERTISTKSNLNYSVLCDIANVLGLDVGPMMRWEKHLNSLVHLRNNIAHGSRPEKLRYSDFDARAISTVRMMESFESVVVDAVRGRVFLSQ